MVVARGNVGLGRMSDLKKSLATVAADFT